jgi:4-amino-4-deoxy-L-arabinose transferase-like glycosyltransferase
MSGFRVSDARLPAFLALGLALQLLVPAARLPLAPDEAYYWYWGQFPAPGYFDHPPLVAWTIALTTAVGGDTELWVRAGALAFFAGTQALLFATTRRLFPELPRAAAWVVVLLFNASLLFPGIGLIMTIDSPLVFFWSLALYAGARVLAGGDGRFWWLFGAALGAAMLSKYTAVLLAPCILGFVLAVPGQRRWLARPEPWAGALIALAVFSPVLYWNWRNDWLSFRFQLGHGFREESEPAFSRLLEYLGLQLGVVSPLLWLGLAAGGAAGLWLALRRRDARLGYLFALSWPVVAFFGWTTVVGERAEGNWPAPGYLGAVPLAVAAWHLGGFDRQRAYRIAAGAGLALTLAVSVLIRVHMLHPVLPLPPKDDPLKEFASWPRIGEAVRAAMDRNARRTDPGRARQTWFLISDRGTRLAEAVFYAGIPGIDLTRPERYGFLGDWRARWAGRDAVLILDPGTRPATYACLFRGLEATGTEFVPEYRGWPVDEYRARLYVGRGFRGEPGFPCPAPP